MPQLPPLTVPDVRAWVGDRNLTKGRPYFSGGALRNPRRRDMNLRGECWGTAPTPYQVEIQLDANGIASGSCSCPVGHGGRCKHAAVLLLAWLHSTEAFAEVVDADEALAALDRDRLTQIMKQVYARFPEARGWLDTELTRLTRSPAAAVPSGDAESVAASVTRALDDARTARNGAEVLPIAVEDLLTTARAAASQGDYARAATLYLGVAEGAHRALKHALDSVEEGGDEYDEYDDYDEYGYSGYYDDEADYDAILDATHLAMLALDAAVPGLAGCLEHLTDPTQRVPVIDLLTNVLLMNLEDYVVDQGNFWDALNAALIEHTTPDERRALVARFLDGRPEGGWQLQDYYARHRSIILPLAHTFFTEDDYLALCQDLQAYEELLDELLRLGRVDDAVGELYRRPNPLLYEGIFATHGQADRYYDVIRNLPAAESDPTLIAWLRDHAEARGDLEDALDFARRAFNHSQSTANYRPLRTIATKLGRWEALHRSILERERKANHWPTLVELYLEDQDVDGALDAVTHLAEDRQDPLYSPGVDLRLRVAAAAAATRPDASIALYIAAVDHLLTYRGRPYYARAAELLGRVRDLYRARGQGATWQGLITRYREEYRRLTALQDELAKATLFEREPEAQRPRPSVPGVGLSVAPDQLPPPEQTPRIHVIRAPTSPYEG
jgi:SWIM zinc finger